MKRIPESQMPDTLHTIDHFAVSVSDVKEAVEWYTEMFRCRIAYQDETWAMLDFANVRLALVVPSQHPPHMAVLRQDAASFGKLKTHRDGTRSVYTEDPDGNAVEIMADDET